MKIWSTRKNGTKDDLSGRECLGLGGSTSGVKASKGAFTLIELLVVIAIIAILAAILLPVLDKARAKAVQVQCLNNYKELELCYQMYTEDNNSLLPWNNVNNPPSNWIQGHASNPPDATTTNIQNGVLFTYNKNVKIYACPSMPKVATVGIEVDDFGHVLRPGTLINQTRTCSIEYSMGGLGSATPPPWVISRGGVTWNAYYKASQVRSPSAKLVFCEESEYSLDDGEFGNYPLVGGQVQPSGSPTWWNLPNNRHNHGANFSFLDGHVEYHKWIGPIINQPQYQTGNGSQGDVVDNASPADPDLVWVESGGAQGL